MAKKFNEQPQETIQDVLKLPIVALPDRGLLKEDAELYEIRSALSTQDGKTPVKSYFPSRNKQGEITGFKTRDWTLPKEQDGHFGVVGAVKVSNQMFGQNLLQKGGKKLIIVEGEEEVPATRRAILESLKGTRFEGKLEPNVVSINCGTGNAAENVAHNLDFVQSFTDIVLALDSDQATPKELAKGIMKGKEAKEDIAGLLLSDNIYTITHPNGCKDSRECLQKGYGAELGKILAFGLEKYSPEKIVSGNDVDIEALLKPLREGHYIQRYPKLMEKLHGIRTGNELITYTAFSGVGKSTLNREIAWELCAAGYRVGFIFLEEPLVKTQQSLICLQLGVRLPDFRINPLAVATREAIQQAKDEVLSNSRTFFLDHFGSLKVDKLMQQIKYLHFICGCEHIFIDHISMVVAGLESNNERKDIDMLYEELAAFMTNNTVTIHAVCHLKRVEDNQPKLKDGEEPKPYWRTVKKEMLRGCVDKDTEFLTPNGWKAISDYTKEDEVYIIDKSLKGYFSGADYVKLPCDSFWRLTNQSVDMVLSDEHRVPFISEKTGRLSVIMMEQLADKFIKSKTGFRGLIPQSAETWGKEVILPETLLRLQVAVNADGWEHKRVNVNGYCSIRVKKERKIERLQNLLDSCGISHTKFSVGDYQEFCFIAPLGYKGWPENKYHLSQDQLHTIADELRHWDGELKSGRINSIDKDEADFLQFVYMTTTGKSSLNKLSIGDKLMPDGKGGNKLYSCKEQYRVGVSKTKTSSIRKDQKSKAELSKYESKDGFKYCFTTETGLWLARRNGKIFVTGNSSGIEQMSSCIIALENEVLPDETRGRVRTKILKDREWGILGVCDTMMQLEDGRLHVVPDTDGWRYIPKKELGNSNF